MSADSTFFEESTDQSKVKADIVSKYFRAWAKVIMPTARGMARKIAYIDLYAGPGKYANGTESTPLLILEQGIHDADMREMLVARFNDKDRANVIALRTAVQQIPGIEALRYEPQIDNREVGEDLVQMFKKMSIVPSLLFLDPWGYKGLSLELVNSVVKDWACECIFFFNYNRINMGLNNPVVEEHMDGLFGKARADGLRQRIAGLIPWERERVIVDDLVSALKEVHGRFVLKYRFVMADGSRTSHYLVFVTKHFRGYEIMKDIMAKASSTFEQGVPCFEHNPVRAGQPRLFEVCRPLDELERMLPLDLAGQTLTMQQVYEAHSVGRPYITRNYKEVLLRLEQAGRITANPAKRREGTFANDVVVTFPAQGAP